MYYGKKSSSRIQDEVSREVTSVSNIYQVCEPTIRSKQKIAYLYNE